MSATERPWNKIAANVYTIVREPFSHVLSQYFHCTQSEAHGNRSYGRMPSLDVWLKTYANLTEGIMNKTETDRKIQSLQWYFNCYNPIDSESEFTDFKHKVYSDLPGHYSYPYSPHNTNKDHDHGDRDDETKRIDKFLFDDLKGRYKIIGDMAQMTKTLCAIFIDFTQGKHIPELCDCTNPHDDGDSNNGTFNVTNLYIDPHQTSPRTLEIGYNSKNHSHGVKHHGSSHLKEITQDQRELMAKLRRNDMVLFNISRAVFEEQIRDMETSYGIKICDQWNMPNL